MAKKNQTYGAGVIGTPAAPGVNVVFKPSRVVVHTICKVNWLGSVKFAPVTV
ncbi:MAG: hypothetical protein ACXQTI_10870 [Candidatus Nezhaarchaeales archaeon]